jgi:hypothetical protein
LEGVEEEMMVNVCEIEGSEKEVRNKEKRRSKKERRKK